MLNHKDCQLIQRLIGRVPEAIGESECIIKDDAELKVYDKSNGTFIICSGKDFKEHMMEQYGTNVVEYSNREPNFTPFEVTIDKEDFERFLYDNKGKDVIVNDNVDGHIYLDKIDTSRSGSDGTFSTANKKMAELLGDDVNASDISDYMKQRGYTWHECGNRHTIQMIPNEINQIFSHTGGIGLQKDLETLRSTIQDVTEGKMMKLQDESFSGVTDLSQDDLEKRYELNHNKKKELFG